MIKSFVAVVGVLCWISAASGNGGGFRYGIAFTGGVAPFEPSGTERVQILDEKLDITLYEQDAEVRVRYVMKNITRKKVEVTFGFPIEVTDLGSYEKGTGNRLDNRTIDTRLAKFSRDYQVRADGKKVAHEQKIEPFAIGKLQPFEGSDLIRAIGGWQVSTLAFKPGQKRAIEISYGANHDVESHTVSDDSYKKPPVFRYRLSTAGVWAGPIAKGKVSIRLGQLDPKWLEIKKPAGRFKRAGDAWVWEFKDLEPTMADDLEIIAGPGKHLFSAAERGAAFYLQTDPDLSSNTRRGVKSNKGWQYVNKAYSVKASSTLPDEKEFSYIAANLKNWDSVNERNPKSYAVWSEGVKGQGVGESLSLTVAKPLPLDAIQIHPGHGESEAWFKANSRPSKLKITLNDEHSFKAMLRDVNLDQTIAVHGYSKPVRTVKIEIDAVYPGERFEDTCISDIALISPLAKEPKRYGSR
ncbi:MAG: DUF4424 family protein [Verrucomicrobiota bacterium]